MGINLNRRDIDIFNFNNLIRSRRRIKLNSIAQVSGGGGSGGGGEEPTLQSATIEEANPNILVLVFTSSYTLTYSEWSLVSDYTALTVTGVASGNGTSTINLQLSRIVTGDETITLDGALSVDDFPVTNNTFSPLDIASLTMWFDNNDTSTMTTGAGVMTAQSSKVGAYTRNKPSAITAPNYNPLIGVLPDELGHIGFGGSQGLDLSVTSISDQQGEVFIVFRRFANATLGLTNNQFLFTAQDKDANNRYIMMSDYANTEASLNNSMGVNINNGGTQNVTYVSSAKSVSDKKVIANFRSNGSTTSIGWDKNLSRTVGNAQGTNTGVWFGDVSSQDLITFGYRNIAGLGHSTYFEYEFLYFNEQLSAGDRTKVVNYLNGKHDCYKDVDYNMGVLYTGSSNCVGQSSNIPNRLLPALTKAFIRTGTDTFAALDFGTNNEGNAANTYGAEMSFMACLSEYLDQNCYLEKYGNGGARYCTIDGSNPLSFTTTYKVGVSGGLFETLEVNADELQAQLDSLGGTNKIILFIIGGENDCFYSSDATGLQANINEVIDELLANGVEITHFIINLIKTELEGTGESPTRLFVDEARAGLTAVEAARSNAILLDMANYATGEGVHFQDFQHLRIGFHSFEKIKTLL